MLPKNVSWALVRIRLRPAEVTTLPVPARLRMVATLGPPLAMLYVPSTMTRLELEIVPKVGRSVLPAWIQVSPV